MRHLLTTILIAIVTTTSQAQEIFDAVLNGAQVVMSDPYADEANIAVAQFKVTELRYMNRKAVETQMTYYQMDEQAYYLSEFLSLYLRMLSDMAYAAKKEVKAEIMKYVAASAANPLFKDKDEDTVLAFIDDKSSMTPFSLDTDWHKAYDAITASNK